MTQNTECLPIGVTGLIPVIMFPFFEILSPEEIAPAYFKVIALVSL